MVNFVRFERSSIAHRLRHDESEAEKIEYIRQDPLRAGLATVAHEWPYILSAKRQPTFVGRAIEVNRPYLWGIAF
jgi:hypothetical protein